jgi:hypothetical protein
VHLRPISWNITPGWKSNNTPIPDQYGSINTPAMTVKDTLRQDGMPVGA